MSLQASADSLPPARSATPESASVSPARATPYTSETVRHAALPDNVLSRFSIALNASIARPPNSWIAAY